MLDRSVAPGFEKITTVDFPKVKSVSTSKGIPIHYINAGVQPVCKIEILFHSGKRLETKPGMSFVTFKMIAEGTKRYSSAELADLIDNTGSYLEIDPGTEFSSLELHFLRDKAEKVIPVLFEMISNPLFPEAELQKQKKIIRQNIAIELERNDIIATRKFREIIFGKDNPHGYSINPEDIENIERTDLDQFFNGKIKRNPIEIFISGMVDDSLLELIEQQSSHADYDLKANSRAPIQVVPNIGKVHIDREEKNQTSIRIGKLAIPKTHPDYIKLLVTNEILGGYFGSRLMQNIREDKGLTYGIYSMLVPVVGDGYFVISADARKELKDRVVEEIFNEVNQLRTSRVEQDELVRVVNYLFGEFLSSVNTPFNLMEKYRSIHLYGLDYSYFDRYFSTLNTLNSNDVIQMATNYFTPEDMTVVTVG